MMVAVVRIHTVLSAFYGIQKEEILTLVCWKMEANYN